MMIQKVALSLTTLPHNPCRGCTNLTAGNLVVETVKSLLGRLLESYGIK